jgi:predicted short-subunit dehydrogenase-like oxidoreductase (DUF2520 family)
MSVVDIREFVDEAKTKAEEYQPAVKDGLQALRQATDLLEALDRGDHEAVEKQITQWEDVNRTLAAVGSMDEILSRKGVEWDKVAKGLGKVLSFGLSVAASV